jgi:hypothetical protein
MLAIPNRLAAVAAFLDAGADEDPRGPMSLAFAPGWAITRDEGLRP